MNTFTKGELRFLHEELHSKYCELGKYNPTKKIILRMKKQITLIRKIMKLRKEETKS